jgi:hypothetical protein
MLLSKELALSTQTTDIEAEKNVIILVGKKRAHFFTENG